MDAKRIKELQSMGFKRFGTHNYPEIIDGEYFVVMKRSNPVRSKISVFDFTRAQLIPRQFTKSYIYNSDPLGSAKTKKLFENLWFDTPEECWNMADWFVNNYVYTKEIKDLHEEYLNSPVSKSADILKSIRKVRKGNKSVLNYMIDRWNFKEEFTL